MCFSIQLFKIRIMKRYLSLLFLLLFVATVACREQAHEHAEETATYTCPMHPQIVQHTPGTCPICGMDLVPQAAAHGETIPISDNLAFLLQPTNQTIISAVATVTPVQKSVQAAVQMDGIITYDERQVYTIPARVGGRIERLFVKYNFQPIHKGQKLLEIYSPELVTAQKELLYLVESASEDNALLEASKQKLRFLGATQGQINQLIRTGKVSYTFALHSPYDGYLIGLNTTTSSARPAPAGASAATGGSMGGGASVGMAAKSSGELEEAGQGIELREGIYVSPGQSLLRVVNPDKLWAEFNVAANQMTALAKGATLQLTFPQLPGEQLQAQIDFVQPFYAAGENFAKIRAYLPGRQKLARVGQLVTATASYTTAPALWVPREAILDLGTKSVVFQKQYGAFKPIAVTIGNTNLGLVQVLDGLQALDTIATNAQFLIDSESFVKINE